MCLIILKPKNVEVPEGLLRTAYNRNKHGWGLMRVARKGIFMRKSVGSFDDFLANYRQYKEYECAIHFRACSAGIVNRENCHPFRVNEETYLMHNGHFSNIVIQEEKMSDTWHFAKMLSKYSNEEIFSKTFIEKLERLTVDQRLILLNKDRGFVVLNKDLWFDDPNGTLYSNIYSFDPSRELLVHNWGEKITQQYEKEMDSRKKAASLENEAESKQGVPYETRAEYIEFWQSELRKLDEKQIEKDLNQDLREASRLQYDKESDLVNQDAFYPVEEDYSIEQIASNIDIVSMTKDEVKELTLNEPDVMSLVFYRTIQRL